MKMKIITLMVSTAVLGANPAFGMLDDLETKDKPTFSQRIVIEENNENTIPSKNLSWMDLASLPVTFFTSLFEPFMNQKAQEFYKNQITQVTDEGVTHYAYGKVRQGLTTIKNNPSDAFRMGGAIALGWTSVEEYSPLIPLAVGIANNVKYSQTLRAFADSISTETIMQKGLKIALYGGAVYCVASLPATAALDWNSLACEAPNGSYRDSCTIRSAREYLSSDPNLAKVPMCKFDIDCRDLSGKFKEQVVFLPKADVQCLKYRENCDGTLVMRSGTERLCTTLEAIKEQVDKIKTEL